MGRLTPYFYKFKEKSCENGPCKMERLQFRVFLFCVKYFLIKHFTCKILFNIWLENFFPVKCLICKILFNGGGGG
jgi:hypothetical protein